MQNFGQLWKQNSSFRQVSIVSLLLLVLAIPLTVFLSGEQQNLRQEATDTGYCSVTLARPPAGYTVPLNSSASCSPPDNLTELEICGGYWVSKWCEGYNNESDEQKREAVFACRGWSAENVIKKFGDGGRGRVRYIVEHQMLGFINTYGDTLGRKYAWNYLMKEAKDGVSSYGETDNDLDTASRAIFGRNFADQLAYEGTQGCTTQTTWNLCADNPAFFCPIDAPTATLTSVPPTDAVTPTTGTTPTTTVSRSPNCSLTGPTTVTIGVPATYTGSFYSPEGQLAGVIQAFKPDYPGTNGDILFFPWRNTDPEYPKNFGGAIGTPISGTQTFTWTPPSTLAPGVYPVFCRAWNDSIEECTGDSATIRGEYQPSVCTGTGTGVTAGQAKLMVTVQALGANDAVLNFSFLLHGIGKGGDNINPTTPGNANPVRRTRDLWLEVYKPDGSLHWEKKYDGALTYHTTGVNMGKYTAQVTAQNLPAGNYILKTRTDNYLKRQIPRTGSVAITSTNNFNDIALVTGDANMDNKLDINDYQIFYNCYSNGAPARSCTASQKLSTDFNDDGRVTLADLNIFTRELSAREGD